MSLKSDIAKVMYQEANRHGNRSKRKPTLEELDRQPLDWARVEQDRRMDVYPRLVDVRVNGSKR